MYSAQMTIVRVSANDCPHIDQHSHIFLSIKMLYSTSKKEALPEEPEGILFLLKQIPSMQHGVIL
jgi:hypothetical protein